LDRRGIGGVVPIYEYRCRACSHQFEALVRPPDAPACPSCHAADLERMLSAFAVSAEGRSRAALHKAREQFTHSPARRDQIRHEQETIGEHVQEEYGLRVPKPED
jgi:putative FmdB family regulatory protein